MLIPVSEPWQGRPNAPRRRKMRHKNPRGGGTKIRKLAEQSLKLLSPDVIF